MRLIVVLSVVLGLYSCKIPNRVHQIGPWPEKKSWEWYNCYDWLIGTNYIPSTAINQLEFWQEATFDTITISRELGWSADIGMNVHRVYLHNLLWDQDSTGFLKRLDTYLSIADQYSIKTLFVLLDDCWGAYPKTGVQPRPVPYKHNSGWVQAPGHEILSDTARHQELKNYITGVISYYANDERVLCWDLYNEPKNNGGYDDKLEDKESYSLALLKKVFAWAREVNPRQPLTAGVWKGGPGKWESLDSMDATDRFIIENVDVISFHAYDHDMQRVKKKIEVLKQYGRPLLCTEYMARVNNNTFFNMLPILKKNNVAAINWGFIAGKTNTIYPWDCMAEEAYHGEPEVWFHDILRQDGTPYDEKEIRFLKSFSNTAE
jgi:hypothetical protein